MDAVITATTATTSLMTDLYELTMVDAARQAGTSRRRAVFDVFTRSLPEGRRYGVVAGIGRVLEAVEAFRFSEADLIALDALGVLSAEVLDFLADYRFRGDVSAVREGELFFPLTPVLRVEAAFEDAVLLETVVLSILNHDSGVASAGSRMITAARGRPCIEMGSRRVHEEAAVAAARAAAVVGFTSTSNLAASARYGLRAAGTAAHAFTLLFDAEDDAFRAQIAAQGAGSTLLVDTYDVETAVRHAVQIAGRGLGAVRLDSGNLPQQAREVRALLDELGATSTRIIATSDLDEHRLEEMKDAPLDGYGIGTRLVTGSGHPAPGFVYKLVEREGADGRMHPVAKRSTGKSTPAGRSEAWRLLSGAAADDSAGAGRALAEAVLTGDGAAQFEAHAEDARSGAEPGGAGVRARRLLEPLLLDGRRVHPYDPAGQVLKAAEHHRAALAELGLEADAGPDGPVAIPTVTDVEGALQLLR